MKPRTATSPRLPAVIRMIPALVLCLFAGPSSAQTGAGNGLPDRFQIDAGWFRVGADTVLNLGSPSSSRATEIDFERDLKLAETAQTFWVDSTWRVGRRHQLKLSFTRLNRESQGGSLLREDVIWGGTVFKAGLTATGSSGNDILSGYYRFALVRNDRFEFGPAIGIGHMKLNSTVRAEGSVTVGSVVLPVKLEKSGSYGSVTGDIGGYMNGWLSRKVVLRADILYIKVKPENSEASVTDGRMALDFYPRPHVGVGVQYKYNKYTYDRGVIVQKLGGSVTYKGTQVYASFLF